MNTKSYLRNQIKLITLKTSDLFTAEEAEMYHRITDLMNVAEAQKKLKRDKKEYDEELMRSANEERRQIQSEMTAVIAKHADKPREVRIEAVTDYRTLRNENDDIVYPPGITWWTLKPRIKIAEFCSEESRAMGLQPNDITFDKIIIEWKSTDILKQIVVNGFYMTIIDDNGEIIKKHYRFMTASAGQLRVDKAQFISDDAWAKIKDRLECGLSWDAINRKGGVNTNKYLAYLALPCGATQVWDFDINKCIVINDFEAPVSGLMDVVNPDYTVERKFKEIMITHTDGCGMMLPKAAGVYNEEKNAYEYPYGQNFMVRGPWIKGLLSTFDFIKFCEVNNVEPVIKDIYGKEYHLINDDIQVIFCKSQFKMCKYYESWDDYKQKFHQCGCNLCRTNYEESYIEDTTISYQMLQTLEMTDEEIREFTQKTYGRINDICRDKETMLHVLRADEEGEHAYQRALTIYEPLLRDGYAKDTLKAIKKKWIWDAKAGSIKCKNKRLYVIPDLYAACEYWFMHIPSPKGLLTGDEVACWIHRKEPELEALRSPHLACEHMILYPTKDMSVYNWYTRNGFYTSCHSLISRVDQFDNDGDQLNVITDKTIIQAAKRNIEKFDVVPLYYELEKADPNLLNEEEMYKGLKRAHDFSGIGQVSNMLTKVWSKDDCDRHATKLLTYYNNVVISNVVTFS